LFLCFSQITFRLMSLTPRPPLRVARARLGMLMTLPSVIARFRVRTSMPCGFGFTRRARRRFRVHEVSKANDVLWFLS
jgi:hypothetical protein